MLSLGIQKVDRTTVPELIELASVGESLQTALDHAEAGMTPPGLPENTIPFDLNPNAVVDGESVTHFEQIHGRAKATLNNALAAFDEAKDVTRLMRSEQDSLADVQTAVARQELAYENTLIEMHGTPYPDGIGPGKTWRQGYAGPDLAHSLYVDFPEINFEELWNYAPTGDPGLSSTMAEMWADWSVVKGRLGFNNPDGYGTTVSLRREFFRIPEGSENDHDSHWKNILHQGRKNLLLDADVQRHCLQIDPGNGQAVRAS